LNDPEYLVAFTTFSFFAGDSLSELLASILLGHVQAASGAIFRGIAQFGSSKQCRVNKQNTL
jgi:hypothetical protein